MNYIAERELIYETILSKGKGTRTRKLDSYLILIANNVSTKFYSKDRDTEHNKDAHQHALFQLFKNWKSFDVKKYSSALPYYTEVYKRGRAEYVNIFISQKKLIMGKMISPTWIKMPPFMGLD